MSIRVGAAGARFGAKAAARTTSASSARARTAVGRRSRRRRSRRRGEAGGAGDVMGASAAQARVDDGAGRVVGIVDVDHFKSVNDRFGHDIGDGVLIELARCLRQDLVPGDVVARLGGEESGVVLADVDGGAAFERAEDLRRRVEALACGVGLGGVIRVTVSIGLAPMARDVAVTDTVRTADLAMFQAKADGRNRVRAA